MPAHQRYSPVVIVVVLSLFPAVKGYEFAGGTGEPNDPYQIATAEQLISIGSDPNLLDKHFVLLNDIDLDPNLPGGQSFTRAMIAPGRPSVPSGGGSGCRASRENNRFSLSSWRNCVTSPAAPGLFLRDSRRL